MKECPSCALEVSKDEAVCPHCGYEFPETPSSIRWVAWLMALLLVWPLLKIIDWLF